VELSENILSELGNIVASTSKHFLTRNRFRTPCLHALLTNGSKHNLLVVQKMDCQNMITH